MPEYCVYIHVFHGMCAEDHCLWCAGRCLPPPPPPLSLYEMLAFRDAHLKISEQIKTSPTCAGKKKITPGSLYSPCVLVWQNYFRDAWNVFDFVTVLGSITDILVTEIAVSTVCSIYFIYKTKTVCPCQDTEPSPLPALFPGAASGSHDGLG